ncbi:LysR substrate-binding domain-containing protein [Tabrizicola soli]|uniref:LysR substrate-binding domain-containing protein n=1 Tax=Tabrizicola soli TaxID=2185115 RepID=A0ABV7DY46_9RHOB|nr:LysR substrate-binding domain-containing protein [Tabrizicola soli]
MMARDGYERGMHRLRFILPPPNLLVTFEAAGRLMSFTRAAEELNVTRVAVSQQIKALETYLGVLLFHRENRSLSFTHVGKRYHDEIVASLERAVRATADIVGKPDSNILVVTATTGFATYWLMPRIGTFRHQYPEIDLRFVVSDRYLDIAEESIDIAIRYGAPPTMDVNYEYLQQEIIAPTCSIDFIAPGRTLRPEDLETLPLIHLDGPYDQQTRWQNWFEIHGRKDFRLKGGITVNTYTNLVQAVLDGQGFALIGTPLMEAFLASGKLIQPVLAEPIKRRSFYLATPATRRPTLAGEAFISWIREAFKLSV